MFAKLQAAYTTLRAFIAGLIATFTEPGFKQTVLARRIFAIGGALVAILLGRGAFNLLTAESKIQAVTVEEGERLLFAVNAAARLKLAVLVLGLGLMAVGLIYQVFDRTELGKHLTHWSEKDTEHTEAMKTLNSGLIFAAMFLGIFTVLAQVIR